MYSKNNAVHFTVLGLLFSLYITQVLLIHKRIKCLMYSDFAERNGVVIGEYAGSMARCAPGRPRRLTRRCACTRNT